MVNPEKLAGILTNLERFLTHLRNLAAIERDVFLADFTKTGSARYFLQVSIESCINAANHIIASGGLRAPQSFSDAFVVLNENDIIPAAFLPTLRQMVRFRNRLVHLYWEVDDQVVYEVLQTNLNDLDTFAQYVLAFMEQEEKSRGNENG